MKKVIAVALVLALCLSLAACGKSDNQGNSSESGETTKTNTAKRELAEGENLITGYKPGDVTLGQYTGLTYTVVSTEVTDDEVQAKLEQFANSYKYKVEITDREEVQTGDIVDIDYVGKIDGNLFDGGTGSNPTLTIGSGSFIPGFEDSLIGKKKGEFSINVTFPENYRNADLAGKPAVFDITLKGIYKYEIPAISDELINEKTSGKYETVDAYKENIRNQIKEEKEEDAETQKFGELIQKAIDNATFNFDKETEIKRGMDSIKAYNDSAIMSAYGMDAAGYYKTYLGMTNEQYEQMIRAQAELSVLYEYVRSAIVEKEGFQVTDDEIKELGVSFQKQYAYSSLEDFYAKLEELYGVEAKVYLAEQVKLNKATDLILDTAVPEDK